MKESQNHIVDLSDFDREVSLYQLIPVGSGKGLVLLKKIVDYILTAKPRRLPAVLITGGEGVKTHARAYLRALALEDTREIDGNLLQQCSSLIEYTRSASLNTGYIIAGVHQLDQQVMVKMIDILSKRHFSMFNFMKESKETFHVEGNLILTAPLIYMVPESIQRTVDYHVALDSYTYDQKLLLCLQRIKYCGIGYRSEEVLEEIVMRANGDLRRMVQILQIGITLISSEGRLELDVKDIRKAADLLPQSPQSKS
jgi:hypothetical protein